VEEIETRRQEERATVEEEVEMRRQEERAIVEETCRQLEEKLCTFKDGMEQRETVLQELRALLQEKLVSTN
jgi:hypothetical protein